MVVGVDRILAARDARDVENRVVVFERIETGVIAEGPFACASRQVQISLEHDFRIRRNFDVGRFAFHHFDWLAAKKSGKSSFRRDPGQRQYRGIHRRGIGSYRHRHVHAGCFALRRQPPVMLGALLVRLPVHPGGLLIVDLHPVHAAVPFAVSGFFENTMAA